MLWYNSDCRKHVHQTCMCSFGAHARSSACLVTSRAQTAVCTRRFRREYCYCSSNCSEPDKRSLTFHNARRMWRQRSKRRWLQSNEVENWYSSCLYDTSSSECFINFILLMILTIISLRVVLSVCCRWSVHWSFAMGSLFSLWIKY